MRGRVAVVECYQRIPCNPCQSVCPKQAIRIGSDINNVPVLDAALCTGCGLCVCRCPGLAIMLARLYDGKAELSLPYEFLPLPEVGDAVIALDRTGEPVCQAAVTHVNAAAACDRTPVVRIMFDAAYLYDVRNFSGEVPV